MFIFSTKAPLAIIFFDIYSMCGIAGIISPDATFISREQLQKMGHALSHRGPDGEGQWINNEGNVGLAHTRLAVIDLSLEGAQPMHYLNRYTIVYNGEIYNYIEIKEFLHKKGYRFTSNTDTEVILAAYDFWKEECLQQFDGMFAFAITDVKENTVFAARDRFGEKPFYFVANQQYFAFASEMKALWSIGISKIMDNKMLLNYLALGHVQNATDKEQTFFENIFSLPPGYFLKLNIATLLYEQHSYWDIEPNIANTISSDDAIEKFNELFTQSIKRRLRSDVELGTSLSGGLDSSSILNNLLDTKTDIKTFSAIFPGFEKDEAVYINLLANYFAKGDASKERVDTCFTQPSALGLIKDFETLCYHQEEPFQSGSIYAQYKVFELAKTNGVKVLLDGQGADETLAGYNKYIHWYLQQLVLQNKFTTIANEKKLLKNNGQSFKWGIKNYIAAYFPAHATIRLEQIDYNKTFGLKDINKDFLKSLIGREWEGIRKPTINNLNDILYFNTRTMGLEELLRYADRNSMAHGREVRLPFLSHELVEFIFSLPANFKIKDGYTKWLLRAAMNKKLPDEIVWRKDKIGYEPPQAQWMQNEIMMDYIQEAKRTLVNNNILQPDALNKKIIPKAAHAENNYDWRYLCAAQLLKP